jgi:hypothetical protein
MYAKAYEELLAYIASLTDRGSDAPSYVERNMLIGWQGMLTIKPHEDYPDILEFEVWPGPDTLIRGRVMLHDYSQLKHIIKAAYDINRQVNDEKANG